MPWYHPKHYAALRAEKRKLQAASSKRFKLHAASFKPQVTRVKLQAGSYKLPDS